MKSNKNKLKAVSLFLFGLLLLFAPGNIYAGMDQNPFVFISIDIKTEKTLNKTFPFERSLIAEFIEKLKEFKPKAIVFKFFIDLPKNAQGDSLLAKSFLGIPVFHQATISKETFPNPLMSKFSIGDSSQNLVTPYIANPKNAGWIPLPIFQSNCQDVGFVDYNPKKPDCVPLVTQYGDMYYRSLWFSLIAFLYPQAEFVPGKYLSVNNKIISLTAQNEVNIQLPETASITNEIISLIDVIEGKIDQIKIEGKIVILMYSGKSFYEQYTQKGAQTPHEIFLSLLEGFYNKIK